MEEESGVFNESADRVERVDRTWTDTKLDMNYDGATYRGEPIRFDRLICSNCRGISFEVLSTMDYETTAKCMNCKMYYIVHTG